MEQTRKSTYRKPATDEQRLRGNEYRRQYALKNPERVARWRLNAALHAIERAVAAAASQKTEG